MGDNELVSIIMLSHNVGEYIIDSVKSVLSQTYQNWELLFVDNSSNDNTLDQVLELRNRDSRIKVSHFLYEQDSPKVRRSAISEAKGRWIAFLEGGCVWDPNKLRRQVDFMEEKGYLFSYTKYELAHVNRDTRRIIGGKKRITYEDMLKCCWPGYNTVMYDASQIGKLNLKDLKEENGYSIWLSVSKKADCYLLDESLAIQRQSPNRLSSSKFGEKLKWRYKVYRAIENKGQIMSLIMAVRCILNGLLIKLKYVEKKTIQN